MFLDAAATTAEGAGSISNILTLLMIPLLLIIMYFVMIRPQRKQEKEANNMRNSLSVGDEITTIEMCIRDRVYTDCDSKKDRRILSCAKPDFIFVGTVEILSA